MLHTKLYQFPRGSLMIRVRRAHVQLCTSSEKGSLILRNTLYTHYFCLYLCFPCRLIHFAIYMTQYYLKMTVNTNPMINWEDAIIIIASLL